MTPAARTAAAIDLLGAIEDSIARRGPAADTLAQRYFRQRRYAGAKDRAAVLHTVYAVLRRRGELSWRLQSAGAPVTPRGMVLLELLLSGALNDTMFGGDYGPTAMDTEERRSLEAASAFTDPPLWAQINVPTWLADRLLSRFGEAVQAEMAALNERAPVDVRVNTLKTTRDAALKTLEDAGLKAEPTPLSPIGIRLVSAVAPKDMPLVGEGAAEVQDEASQLASLLARPKAGFAGAQLAELAAGAGGKTLAFGALTANSGQIYAMDTDKKRLDELKSRADRAGMTNLQIHRITTGEGKRAGQFARFAKSMDITVVDAPCSGSGTWRRNPELRWRIDPDRLAEHQALQVQLVQEAMTLAKAGGRVAYMTCSILREENEDVLDAVLAAAQDWSLVDYRRLLEPAGVTAAVGTAAEAPETLQLTPARHGTDGFFFALLAHEMP